jgi:acetolactate synthase I/II/III large subunit
MHDEATVTGGDLLAASLESNDVRIVFGLPGVQLDAAFDALARRDHVRVVHTRNEQSTSFMADGYARVSGRIGCCLVVPGPGLLNAMAGLSTAYACSSPVLCIAGQIPTAMIERDYGLLHEIPNQLGIVRSAVRWAERSTRPEQVPALVAEAVREALRGRPRPAALELPPDVLEARVPAGLAARGGGAAAGGDRSPDDELLERAAGLLGRAERPLIVAGAGVLRSGAWVELQELAERLQAPVVLTANGKGALSSRHPLACEPLAMAALLGASDVVIAVGTRFATLLGPRWRVRDDQHLVRLDADPTELCRGTRPAVAIEADASRALGLLAELLPPSPGRTGWRGLDVVRERTARLAAGLEPQASYVRALREALPDDAIVIDGMTQVGYWARACFPVYQPRTWLTSGYQGTLGFELPTGLGAQAAAPDRRVVVIVGDGGLLFNVQELATAVQHGLPVIAVVFNDDGYGNVRRAQRQRIGRSIASDLRNPDLGRLAGSFDVLAIRAGGPDALRAALTRALDHPGPVLVEVPVGDMPDPWPYLLSAEPL